jgi:hypothetical protein
VQTVSAMASPLFQYKSINHSNGNRRSTMGFMESVCLFLCIWTRLLILSPPSGVFLCIRCSGIHRGMGTHISKVKSVDLDVWTPEQMAVRSISCFHAFYLHFNSISRSKNGETVSQISIGRPISNQVTFLLNSTFLFVYY